MGQEPCSRSTPTRPLDVREAIVSEIGPRERLRVFVVQVPVLPEGPLQPFRGAMPALPDASLGERGEPAFYLVEARGRGQREVHPKARAHSKLALDAVGFVRAALVLDQVNVEHVGDPATNGVREV